MYYQPFLQQYWTKLVLCNQIGYVYHSKHTFLILAIGTLVKCHTSATLQVLTGKTMVALRFLNHKDFKNVSFMPVLLRKHEDTDIACLAFDKHLTNSFSHVFTFILYLLMEKLMVQILSRQRAKFVVYFSAVMTTLQGCSFKTFWLLELTLWWTILFGYLNKENVINWNLTKRYYLVTYFTRMQIYSYLHKSYIPTGTLH